MLGKKKSIVINNLLEQYLDNTVQNQFSYQDDTILYSFSSRKEWSKNFVPDLLNCYLKESLLL